MPRENVELARALLPQSGTDIVPLIRDEDGFALVREVLSPLITDDFESVMVWPAVSRTYAGLDGLRKNWLDWLEPWATYRSTYEELIDVGEHVVVLLRDHGRRKDMEIEVEVIAATTLTFREGSWHGGGTTPTEPKRSKPSACRKRPRPPTDQRARPAVALRGGCRTKFVPSTKTPPCVGGG